MPHHRAWALVPAPTLGTRVSWRAAAPDDPILRRRIAAEVEAVSWSVSQMQALLMEAEQATGLEHAFLMPRMELRLPLYDVGLRYRIVVRMGDNPRVTLVDQGGRIVAEVAFP